MRSWALLAALLLLPACAHAPAGISETDEQSDAADRWMRQLRAYPFGVIPVDALNAGRTLKSALRQFTMGGLENPPYVAPYTWLARGPQPTSVRWGWGFETGRLFAVAASPADPSVILIGSASGGIWRSDDGGTTFAPVSDDQADLSVGAIAFAPSDPSIVYAGMGSDFFGTGMLKSIDGGRHWSRLASQSTPNVVRKIVVDPTDANHLWVAQGGVQEDDGQFGPAGLLFSRDGGSSWTTTFRGRPDSLVMRPHDPTTLYMTARASADPGLTSGAFRSTDGGLTWTNIYAGPYAADKFPILRLDVSTSDPQTLYIDWWATVGEALTARLVRSTDGGATWTDVPTKDLPSERPTYLAIDPRDAQTLYLGLRDLYKSTDGGATWTNLTLRYNGTGGAFSPTGSRAHEDQRGFAFSADGAAFYAATDGGLFRSADGGKTLEALGASLGITQLYVVAPHPTNPSLIFIGLQDNGLQRVDDGSSRWREVITGDFGSIVFSSTDPSRFIGNYIAGVIYRFSDNGNRGEGPITSNATFGEPATSPRISFLAPMAGQRRTGRIYFGTWRLFASSNLGTTWTPTAGTTDLTRGGTDTLTEIAVSESDDTIYTGSAAGAVRISRDAGATWKDVTAGLPDRAVGALAIDPRDALTAYAGFSGYRTPHVYRTTDGGTTWTEHSAGLPDVPLNALYLDGSNPPLLYAGTDLSVFRYDPSARRWTALNEGLPPVVVMSFATTADGRLLIATYGRGVYELVPLAPRRRAAGR